MKHGKVCDRRPLPKSTNLLDLSIFSIKKDATKTLTDKFVGCMVSLSFGIGLSGKILLARESVLSNMHIYAEKDR